MHRVRGGERTECVGKKAHRVRSEPNSGSRVVMGETNGAATDVEGAYAACGGAGGVRGLERRRPTPPSRLLRLRPAQPIELRPVAARPRDPRSATRSRT